MTHLFRLLIIIITCLLHVFMMNPQGKHTATCGKPIVKRIRKMIYIGGGFSTPMQTHSLG